MVILLVLNGIGGLIYFFRGPKFQRQTESAPHVPNPPDDAEMIKLNSFQSSWNPYFGSNFYNPGEELNPIPVEIEEV
jgi:hypothetical protein